jgi:bifunctional enzyme CysN/CysC/sulfate adenylyltransferase subunit 1
VPISALEGDNVVNKSENTPWFTGQPLMEILETVEVSRDKNLEHFRFPVQYVTRPDLNFRGFCGTYLGNLLPTRAGGTKVGHHFTVDEAETETRLVIKTVF